MTAPLRPKIELLWLSTADRGRELEVHAEFGGVAHVVATIVADDSDESHWLQLDVAGTQIQVPLGVFRDAIASADGVHSEAWFKRSVEGYAEADLSPAARAIIKRRADDDGT